MIACLDVVGRMRLALASLLLATVAGATSLAIADGPTLWDRHCEVLGGIYGQIQFVGDQASGDNTLPDLPCIAQGVCCPPDDCPPPAVPQNPLGPFVLVLPINGSPP